MSIEQDIRYCDLRAGATRELSGLVSVDPAILARVAAAARAYVEAPSDGKNPVKFDDKTDSFDSQKWADLEARVGALEAAFRGELKPEPLGREWYSITADEWAKVNRLRVAARALVDVRLGYAPQAADVTVPRRLIDDLRAALDA